MDVDMQVKPRGTKVLDALEITPKPAAGELVGSQLDG